MSADPAATERCPVPEQPEDWTEPGAYSVAPGVHRLPLPMRGSSLRAVNLYLVEHGDELLAVDSGWALPETTRQLADSLRQLGYHLSDLTKFVITHAHHDHYTHALILRERFGCEVALGRGERPSVVEHGWGSWTGLEQRLRRAGAAQLADRFVTDRRERLRQESVWGEPSTWLDDGDRLDVAGRGLEVRDTPGHTRGHIVIRDPVAGLLFAGDHVLPHITPSVGFETAPEPMPLRSYLASLRLVRDLPDALLLPAHGPVTASVHRRVDEILEHHQRRFDRFRERLATGDATAYQIASRVTWTRRGQRLAELQLANGVLAVLETLAHLDLLVEAGEATQQLIDGVAHFELVTP